MQEWPFAISWDGRSGLFVSWNWDQERSSGRLSSVHVYAQGRRSNFSPQVESGWQEPPGPDRDASATVRDNDAVEDANPEEVSSTIVIRKQKQGNKNKGKSTDKLFEDRTLHLFSLVRNRPRSGFLTLELDASENTHSLQLDLAYEDGRIDSCLLHLKDQQAEEAQHADDMMCEMHVGLRSTGQAGVAIDCEPSAEIIYSSDGDVERVIASARDRARNHHDARRGMNRLFFSIAWRMRRLGGPPGATAAYALFAATLVHPSSGLEVILMRNWQRTGAVPPSGRTAIEAYMLRRRSLSCSGGAVVFQEHFDDRWMDEVIFFTINRHISRSLADIDQLDHAEKTFLKGIYKDIEAMERFRDSMVHGVLRSPRPIVRFWSIRELLENGLADDTSGDNHYGAAFDILPDHESLYPVDDGLLVPGDRFGYMVPSGYEARISDGSNDLEADTVRLERDNHTLLLCSIFVDRIAGGPKDLDPDADLAIVREANRRYGPVAAGGNALAAGHFGGRISARDQASDLVHELEDLQYLMAGKHPFDLPTEHDLETASLAEVAGYLTWLITALDAVREGHEDNQAGRPDPIVVPGFLAGRRNPGRALISVILGMDLTGPGVDPINLSAGVSLHALAVVQGLGWPDDAVRKVAGLDTALTSRLMDLLLGPVTSALIRSRQVLPPLDDPAGMAVFASMLNDLPPRPDEESLQARLTSAGDELSDQAEALLGKLAAGKGWLGVEDYRKMSAVLAAIKETEDGFLFEWGRVIKEIGGESADDHSNAKPMSEVDTLLSNVRELHAKCVKDKLLGDETSKKIQAMEGQVSTLAASVNRSPADERTYKKGLGILRSIEEAMRDRLQKQVVPSRIRDLADQLMEWAGARDLAEGFARYRSGPVRDADHGESARARIDIAMSDARSLLRYTNSIARWEGWFQGDEKLYRMAETLGTRVDQVFSDEDAQALRGSDSVSGDLEAARTQLRQYASLLIVHKLAREFDASMQEIDRFIDEMQPEKKPNSDLRTRIAAVRWAREALPYSAGQLSSHHAALIEELERWGAGAGRDMPTHLEFEPAWLAGQQEGAQKA